MISVLFQGKPFNITVIRVNWASLVAQKVKHLTATQETRVRFLGQEDPLEKEMATHSSILAWKIPRTEEPSRLYSPWGHKESDMTERLTHALTTNAEEVEDEQFYEDLQDLLELIPQKDILFIIGD